MVEKTTPTEEFKSVKEWTDLWKTLLREEYAFFGFHFKKLVRDFRMHGCIKHEATIKTWLQDDARIGPDDDADLISIALLTNSERLNDNIANVRKAISKMISWRMRASDLVRDKIKDKLMAIANPSIINSSIEIQDLGKVDILKIREVKNEGEEIDKKYVNRLLQKEMI